MVSCLVDYHNYYKLWNNIFAIEKLKVIFSCKFQVVANLWFINLTLEISFISGLNMQMLSVSYWYSTKHNEDFALNSDQLHHPCVLVQIIIYICRTLFCQALLDDPASLSILWHLGDCSRLLLNWIVLALTFGWVTLW